MGYSNETIQRENTKTVDELSEFLSDKTFEDLFTGETSQIAGFELRETIFNTNEFRYVTLGDGQTLDMNHAIASADLGSFGTEVGWVVEKVQILQRRPSGGQQEDYFSNAFGEQMRTYIDEGSSLEEAFEKTVEDHNNGRIAAVQPAEPSQVATIANHLDQAGVETANGEITAPLPNDQGSLRMDEAGQISLSTEDSVIPLGTVENGNFVSQDTQGVIAPIASLIEAQNELDVAQTAPQSQMEAVA